MTEHGGKHVAENIISTATFYIANTFLPHVSKECLDKMVAFIDAQNDSVFRPRGLLLGNPVQCGMLQLEIFVLKSQQ